MKNFLAALSMTCLILAVASVSSAPVVAAPALKAATVAEANAFRKIYSNLDNLTMRSDVAGVGRMLTSDFRMQWHTGQQMNKVQWMRMSTFIAKQTIRVNSVRSVLERIGMRKNEAVVVSSGTADYILRGSDKKRHRVIVSAQAIETWVLKPQGWRMKFSQGVSTRTTVDGRVVDNQLQSGA